MEKVLWNHFQPDLLLESRKGGVGCEVGVVGGGVGVVWCEVGVVGCEVGG